MQKKNTQDTVKNQYGKIQDRIAKALEDVNKLTAATPAPQFNAPPDQNILKNLLAECEDCDFWQNFRKAAPIIYCVAIEQDQQLRAARDYSFIEELLKTKSVLQLLNQKIESGAADVDIIEYSIATKMLEQKLAIMTALNVSVEGDNDDQASFNIIGSNKSIVIDKKKLREAIKIQDKPVVEKVGTAADNVTTELPTIMKDGISEEEFLSKAVEVIGAVKKSEDKKIMQKDSFIKVFKYMGEFAKIRNKEAKKQAQSLRCDKFKADSQEYFAALKSTMQQEEKAYEEASALFFDKLQISQQFYERTQQELMNDPYVSMEVFNMGIGMEQPSIDTPVELTKEKTVELVKLSNDFAFEKFKADYIKEMATDPMIAPVLISSTDPMIAPVLISSIAHDWVFINHGFSEEDFKAALFAHKIYEDPEVSQHMQNKQMELMMLAAQQNPMMMQQMMMAQGGGMGGAPGMGGGMF